MVLAVVTGCWIFLYEIPARGSLFGSPALDLAWMAVCVGIASWRGRPFVESLLWVVLSHRLHLDAMGEFEAFQALVSLAWGGWGVCLMLAETAEQRMLLVGYHLGLTFDTGMCRPIGLGMSFSLDAAALDLLLLTGGMSRIARGSVPALRRIPVVILTGALCLLALSHAAGPGSNTAVMLLALGSMAIFFLAPGPAAAAGDRLMQVLVIAGLPVALAALGMMMGETSLWTAFQKRVFAGGLHPNLLAAYSLAMLTFIIRPTAWDVFPASGRRVARAGSFVAYFGVLLASGGRAAILVFLLLLPIVFRRRFVDVCAGRMVMPVIAVGVLCLYKLSDASVWFDIMHNERFLIWRSAVSRILEQPWLGHGMMALGQLPQSLPYEVRMLPGDWVYPHTHNLFLEIALSGGFPLLALFLAATYVWGTAPALSSGNATLGFAFLVLGLFDFVWFTPSLMALGISRYCETMHGPDSQAETTHAKSCVPWAIMGALMVMICAVFTVSRAPFLYRRSVELLGDRNPAWVETLDKAAAARPTDLSIRLQRLLIRWNTGTAPSDADRSEIDAIIADWSGYYLPRFLRGRLHLLAGHPDRALDDLAASVSLEPRDLLGIRWGHLALARAAVGADPSDAAWEAVLRGAWGPSLVLDHPSFGATMTSMLVSRWKATMPNDIYEAQLVANIGTHLARRGVRLPTKEPDPALAQKFPEHIRDAWALLDLFRNPPANLEIDPSWDMRCLSFMLERAAQAKNKDIFERIYHNIQDKIIRRNKRHEHLDGDFLSVGFLPPEAALERLQALRQYDPGNPWIIERSGDILAESDRLDEAGHEWRMALKLCSTVRLEPVFSGGPRSWALNSTGDQWMQVFETALRRYDPEAVGYHRQAWDEFIARLKRKVADAEGRRP